jgi:hypothetical protein
MEWTGLILIQQFNATRVQPKGAGIMTTDESEQATDRARARAYRTRLRAERDRQIIGSHGPASPCKRIDPQTGEVIEVIAPSTKTPAPYPQKPKRPSQRVCARP